MRVIQRNMVVDRLRGIAILLVLGLHYFGLWTYAASRGEAPLHGAAKVFGHGYLGVNMFFTISGYLIASTSVAKDERGLVSIEAPAFYVRRATRILPLLAVTLAIGAIAVAVAPSGPAREYLFDMPGTVFSAGFVAAVAGFAFNWFRLATVSPDGVHGWFGLHWDVLWSLAVEEQFYVLFPLVILAARTVARLRTVLWAVFAVAVATRVSLAASGADWLTSATNSISCFDALCLGALVALSDPWSAGVSKIAAASGCLGLLMSYLLGYAGWGLPATGMAASTALVAQASRAPGTFPRLHFPLLSGFGILSYGLYLLQAFTFALLPRWVLQIDPFIGFAIALGASTLVAWASFSLFERPVERALRRRALVWMATSRASA